MSPDSLRTGGEKGERSDKKERVIRWFHEQPSFSFPLPSFVGKQIQGVKHRSLD